MKRNIRIYLLTAICILTAGRCFAIDTLNEFRPLAVLVQLRSEHNRIVAMIKNGRYNDVNKVIKDATAANAAMINDFTDNFDECPVYYYMDTNATLIQKKQFAGILFDKDGIPKKNITIDSTSTNYLIACYSYPIEGRVREEENHDSTAPNRSIAYYGLPVDGPINMEDDKNRIANTAYIPVMGRGLIILNTNFKQVNYYLKRGFDDLFVKLQYKRKYFYYSKKFDIEYYPFASYFSRSMLDKDGYSHGKRAHNSPLQNDDRE